MELSLYQNIKNKYMNLYFFNSYKEKNFIIICNKIELYKTINITTLIYINFMFNVYYLFI